MSGSININKMNNNIVINNVYIITEAHNNVWKIPTILLARALNQWEETPWEQPGFTRNLLAHY